MKAHRDTKLLIGTAIVAALVLLISFVVDLIQLSAIYDCAGITPEGELCTDLERARQVTNVARVIAGLATLVLISALVALFVQFIRRNPPKNR